MCDYDQELLKIFSKIFKAKSCKNKKICISKSFFLYCS